MKSSGTIQTERLILREIRKSDTGIIVKFRSDPKVYRYFKNPHCLTTEEHERWYTETYLQSQNMVTWICEKDGAEIGVFAAARLSDTETEVSYLVSGIYQKKGYAGEALGSIIAWIRQEWKSVRIIAEIHVKNTASINFIKRFGFEEEDRKKDFLKFVMKSGRDTE